MLMLLQQSGSPRNVIELINGIFSRPDALAHPQDILQHLQSLSIVWAVVFMIAGLVCLLNGYNLHRWVIVAAGLIMGLLAGYYVGQKINAEYIVAGCLGVLMAVTCMPLMKYAMAVFGGLTGAFIGANAWTSIIKAAVHGPTAEAAASNYWIGALMGLIIFGMLAFILFKFSVVFFTTISGSTLIIFGVMALLIQIPNWRQPITNSISAHAAILPILVLVPAVIGAILQHTQKPVASSGGGAAKK